MNDVEIKQLFEALFKPLAEKVQKLETALHTVSAAVYSNMEQARIGTSKRYICRVMFYPSSGNSLVPDLPDKRLETEDLEEALRFAEDPENNQWGSCEVVVSRKKAKGGK